MGEREISRYISYLAVKRNVAANTQNQALNAVVFLYKQVLNRDLGNFGKKAAWGLKARSIWSSRENLKKINHEI